MTPNQAENLAYEALIWLTEDDERIGGFLGMTGANVEDLRSEMKNPEFLGFVLDFILQNEYYVLNCAEAIKTHPENFAKARAHLPGGMVPEWT